MGMGSESIPHFTPPANDIPTFTPPASHTVRHACVNHPDSEGVGKCAKCGAWVCDECADLFTLNEYDGEFSGATLCANCYREFAREDKKIVGRQQAQNHNATRCHGNRCASRSHNGHQRTLPLVRYAVSCPLARILLVLAQERCFELVA